jgi:hypothetical protein
MAAKAIARLIFKIPQLPLTSVPAALAKGIPGEFGYTLANILQMAAGSSPICD